MSEGNGLPKGWHACTVGEITESLKNGIYKAKEFYAENGTPCLRMYNIDDGRLVWQDLKRMTLSHEEEREYGLVSGDVVVNRVNSRELVGKACVIPEGLGRAVFESKNIRLRVWKGVCDPTYLNYCLLLEGRRYFSANAQQTVGMASVNQEQLTAFPFPLAPLPEQHRIVEKIEELFSDLDAGVASLERAKANLKRYRASVLKSAVEGRLTEEWRKEHPQAEDGQMLLDRILRERREKWEKDQLQKFKEKGKEPPKGWESKYEEPSVPYTSALPVLPEGWVWATVEHCSFVDVGFAFKSSEFADEGIRLLRGENMEPGALRWKDVRYWPTDKVDGYEHLLLSEGDIVLAMDRPLVSAGLKIARAKETDLPALLVQRMARLRVMTEVHTAFLFVTMQTQRFITHLLGEQQGTQLPHISGNSIQEFLIPLPPLAEQEQIVALVEERLSQIDSAEKTIDAELIRSKRLRQSILKTAFEGKLVPQDPKDEPARVLLERIKATKESEQPKKKAKKATKVKAK
jgi:type I restriction enzyme, S subunit